MRTLFVGLGAVIVVSAMAQSRSSFQNVGTIDALGVNANGLDYTVNDGAVPNFSLGGDNYIIQDVFGFWVLSDSDITATQSNTGVWSANKNNAGSGGIAGWKTNPNTCPTAGQSKTFTFSSLTAANPTYGFHVRLSIAGTGSLAGQTLFVTGTPVPEPATMTALALGAAALLKRRKK